MPYYYFRIQSELPTDCMYGQWNHNSALGTDGTKTFTNMARI